MSSAAPAIPEGQFVTLGLDGEVFAVPVNLVREILDSRRITRLPEAPMHVLGLIDVRGRSVPVMDLRACLGMASSGCTEHTRILVLEVASQGQPRVLGLMVDRVFEVRALDSATLEAPPDLGRNWRSEHLLGIGRQGDDFVLLLDIDRMFAAGSSFSF
ncbi:chemotaxis protein CheW [Roseomonas sp. GC11]|uniref:chemotaxis protein CheW n=1 Tax=Roseomonas sp. GC11 TaxID=2950546 RepID=UPI00210E6F4F|nr:chemotaxis protein CheW [Roseomonas sp. GC11]MCQ4163061.1 chemotaxis protein CheW [Roseomonas sp. GC11]